MRLNRAANELNPFLMVVAIGLLILNLTFYLGMAASREPMAGAIARPYSAPADNAAAASFPRGGRY